MKPDPIPQIPQYEYQAYGTRNIPPETVLAALNSLGAMGFMATATLQDHIILMRPVPVSYSTSSTPDNYGFMDSSPTPCPSDDPELASGEPPTHPDPTLFDLDDEPNEPFPDEAEPAKPPTTDSNPSNPSNPTERDPAILFEAHAGFPAICLP